MIFSGMKAWERNFGGQFGGETLAQEFTIAAEHKTERTTKDNAIGFKGSDERGEAKSDAGGNIAPDVVIGNVTDEAAVFFVNSAGGGDVFPFELLTVPDIFGVTRFEIGITFNELAVFDNAATDAGRESEIKGATSAVACFGKCGEVGVVLEINWKSAAKVAMKQSSKIEIMPRQIAEPNSLVALDDPRHSDANGFDIRENKIDANLLEKIVVENVLVGDGGKTDGMQNFARLVEQCDECFGSTNVNTEIHDVSIALIGTGRNNR